MTVRKKPNGSNPLPDPYALAWLMVAHQRDGWPSFSDDIAEQAFHAAAHFRGLQKIATVDDPLREKRERAAVTMAVLAMEALSRMGALPKDNEVTGLTPIRVKIMRFINAQRARQHTAPTYREIATHLHHSSVGSIAKHIERLATDGYLAVGKGPRAIAPTDKGRAIT